MASVFWRRFLGYERSAFIGAAPVFLVLFALIGGLVFWGSFTMDQGPLHTYREFRAGVPLSGTVLSRPDDFAGPATWGDYQTWPQYFVRLDHPPTADASDNQLSGVLIDTRQPLAKGDRVTVLRSAAIHYHSWDYILPADRAVLAHELQIRLPLEVGPFVVIELFWLFLIGRDLTRAFRAGSSYGTRAVIGTCVGLAIGLGFVVLIFVRTAVIMDG